MVSVGQACASVATICLVLGFLIVLIDWILGGFLIGIGLVAIIFYFTWDFAGFLDNSTNKIRKWSRDACNYYKHDVT